MKKVILASLVALVLFSGCTDSSGARKALNEQGYKNIDIGGFAIFGCGEDDTFRTEFSATSSSGHRVNGVVCSGFLKGSTIRTK